MFFLLRYAISIFKRIRSFERSWLDVPRTALCLLDDASYDALVVSRIPPVPTVKRADCGECGAFIEYPHSECRLPEGWGSHCFGFVRWVTLCPDCSKNPKTYDNQMAAISGGIVSTSSRS